MAEDNALWNFGDQKYYHKKIQQEIEKASTGGVTIDDTLSAESTNPIQNKAVAEALQKVEFLDLAYRTEISENSNLDDYKETGSYCVLVAAIAATITNSPVTTSGYYLDVRRRGSDVIAQKATLWTGQEYTRFYNGTTWSAWWNSRNAATANTQTLTAPTSGFTPFYPAFVDSNNNTAAAEALKTNNAYIFQMKGGTADAEGTAQLILGNNILAGTNGNMKGQLIFYNNANSYYTSLNPNTAQTGNTSFALPASGGTLALNTAATATANGLVSTDAQTFAGIKSFQANRLALKMTGVSKGTDPTANQYVRLAFVDNSGSTADNACLGMVYANVTTSGDTGICIAPANNKASTWTPYVLEVKYVKDTGGYAQVAAPYSQSVSCLRNISAGTAAATTTNCPNGALYGQYS